jgi:sortase A
VDWRRWLARIGRVIFAFGLLVLLFVAYQLWGTGISTRFHQEQLRSEFNHELATARHATTTTTTTAASPASSTTTTEPDSGVAQPVPGDVPADGQPVGTIDIPAIGANYVVVEGTTTADLQLGPGHYAGTPLPGQPGNAAIAGHRTTYLAPFFNLNELVAGDPIYLTTTQGRFRYDVSALEVVSPSDVAVIDPTPAPTLTLTTCNPRYSAAQRLVVVAALVSPPAPVPRAAPSARRSTRAPTASASTVSHALAGESGSAWPALGWGAAATALTVGIWLFTRRRPRRLRRVGWYVLGALPLLVVLFFFFQSVSPLLPASF